MKDPIKIIWKYKNKNKNIQYNIYIYVGKTPLIDILEKIKNLNFYNSLIKLTKKELISLEDFYGKYWYYKFFNIHHIKYNLIIYKIKFIQKFGKKWYDIKIKENGIIYNNIPWYNDENILNNTKKIIGKGIETNNDEIDLELDEENISELFDDLEIDDKKNYDNIKVNDNEFKNINITSFNFLKDDNNFDNNLENNFEKYYITDFYIYKNDSIKLIKYKICTSIKNNIKFDNDSYLIPSRQYLWILKSNNKKISINHEINMNIYYDIEPKNNMRIYENLNDLNDLEKYIYNENNKFNYTDNELLLLDNYDIENNEIFLLDIYNELGLNYDISPKQLNNLEKIYLKLYFPKISKKELKDIIDYLNNINKDNEKNIILNEYDLIQHKVKIETSITNKLDIIKLNEKYNIYLGNQYITQTILYLKINYIVKDLYYIFNNFNLSKKYPFIQFKKNNQNVYKKLKNDDDLNEYIQKWIKNKFYGIVFKIKINDKYLSILLDENGRIEYKIQWKEDDYSKMIDIKNTYEYIKLLIKKINKENNIKIIIPDNSDFKYAFINVIQKINFPLNYEIDHNDLSNFSRYFFPYVSMIISPRKRESKIFITENLSKYGTYLKYKKVPNYDNILKIENKILYYIKNYDFPESKLVSEISRQFNITENQASEKIKKIYSNNKLIKYKKILKNTDNLPKFKPPGVGIDIQGKTPDKYKIRISGIKDLKRLNDIIDFISLFLYLYIETYIYKKPEKQFFIKEIEKLENIAKRVDVVKKKNIIKNKNLINIKKMTTIDKKRLGFKPKEGQTQWTKACQNSGNDKKRQPTQYTNVDDIIKLGYKLNPKTKIYEKKINNEYYPAINFKSSDNIYYTCDPDKNGEHKFAGFLTKSEHPDSLCMPCCFKKNQLYSSNIKKRDLFNKCISEIPDINKTNIMGDILYILKDTNKIQENRLSILPENLDIYFNKLNKNKININNHYLIETSGYFLKYCINNNFKNNFLNGILNLFDIKKNIYNLLTENIFISLNNGEIKNKFKTIDNYINHIKKNTSFELLNNFLSTPGILIKEGVNIILFNKKTIYLNNIFEKEKILVDFEIEYQDIEDLYSINSDKKTIFMINENKKYYPIVYITKEKNNKNLNIKNIFNKNDEIITYINDFYINGCINLIKKNNLTAKDVYNIYKNNIKFQIIDNLNKCIYLITKDNYMIPVENSGSIVFLKITNMKNIFINSFENTLNFIKKLPFKLKLIGVYYSDIDDIYINIISLNIYDNKVIYIIPEKIKISEIEKMNLIYEEKPLFMYLDKKIIDNKKITHSKQIKENLYENEGYELFKLEVSNYLNENKDLKEKIIDLINNDNSCLDKIKIIFYKIIDNDLALKYKNLKNINYDIDVSRYKNFIYLSEQKKNILNYTPINNRVLCKDLKNCNENYHCKIKNKKCIFSIPKNIIIIYVNKLSEDLSLNNFKSYEILNIHGYYVSDTINYNYFKEKDNQIIVNNNIIKDNVNTNIPQIVQTNVFYSQKILNDDLKLYRAYSNGYHWINNKHQYTFNRNLGYYSSIQTELANYFKGSIIENLHNNPSDINILKLLSLFKIPIILYDENYNIKNILENGKNIKKNIEDYKKYINIRKIFDDIEIIYYK